MRRITEIHEGILLFVCRGDRSDDPSAVLRVYTENEMPKAERFAKLQRAEVVEEEGLFIRVRSSEGDELIGWQGPFDSARDAYEHLRDEFQFDPETGQDLDEAGDPVDLDDEMDGGEPGFAGFDDF
jgi:hypothetical protein